MLGYYIRVPYFRKLPLPLPQPPLYCYHYPPPPPQLLLLLLLPYPTTLFNSGPSIQGQGRYVSNPSLPPKVRGLGL